MKKLILDFIEFVLEPWFVLRADYDFVQARWWEANRRIDKLNEELKEVCDSIYGKRYKYFAQLSDADKAVELTTESISTDEIMFDWHIRITRKAWVLSYDPKAEIRIVREKIIRRIVSDFYDNIKKRLQWDT